MHVSFFQSIKFISRFLTEIISISNYLVATYALIMFLFAIGGQRPPISPPQTGGPEIQVYIAEPTYQSVPVGSSASFRCQARANNDSPLRITWSKDRGGSIPQGRARDDGQGLLVIAETQPQDSGTYICTATDGYATSSERATLDVTSGGIAPPPPIGSSRPVAQITPRYTTVRLNEPVELRCVATGYPTPIVTWSRPTGAIPSHILVNGEVLRITAIRRADEGEYICRATNERGTATERAVVYVEGGKNLDILFAGVHAISFIILIGVLKIADTRPPVVPPQFGLVVTINPTTYESRPGETVRFQCDSSDRSARIQWSRVSGILPQSASESPDGTLTIYNVREVDAGGYACTATSQSGESSQAVTRLAVSYIR